MRVFMVLLAGSLLAACATMPEDRGSAASLALLQSRSSVAGDIRLRNQINIDEWLKQALDADAAVRVALNRNPQMQSLYAQLGLAQAEVYDASRLSNPSLGFMQLNSKQGNRTTWSLTQNFTELLFIGYRTRVGRTQVLLAQQRVAQSVLDLEASVRAAYYQYLATTLKAQLAEQIVAATQASADYAQSLFDAGNINELQLKREQAAASAARVGYQTALSKAQQQQSALLTSMGLTFDDKASFVDRLDVPVEMKLDVPSLRDWAHRQRVDLAALQEQVRLYDTTLTHTSRWFWLGNAELQLERERDTNGALLKGGGGSVGVPLFNQGSGSRLRARSLLEAAQAEVKATQLSIDNDIVAQMQSLQRALQIVEEYRQKLVPMQERALQLMQQQHNYMLIGTFELLDARRQVFQTYQDYLGAAADYWLQYVALSKTLGGKLPESAGDASYGISIGVDALPDSAHTTAHGDTNMSDMNMGEMK